jgi:hypothetical protein
MEEKGLPEWMPLFSSISEKLPNKKAEPYETVDKIQADIQYRHSL